MNRKQRNRTHRRKVWFWRENYKDLKEKEDVQGKNTPTTVRKV